MDSKHRPQMVGLWQPGFTRDIRLCHKGLQGPDGAPAPHHVAMPLLEDA